jgi:ABC-type sugar transport system permease subunit
MLGGLWVPSRRLDMFRILACVVWATIALMAVAPIAELREARPETSDAARLKNGNRSRTQHALMRVATDTETRR